MTALWHSDDIAIATGAKLGEPFECGGVQIDSRLVQAGDMFVALPGEHVDGHDFVAKAFKQGASAALVNRSVSNVPRERLIIVDNVLQALQAMARYRRKQFEGKVVGITGSVGKTSVKEGCATMLRAFGSVHATSGNYNNHIGLPLTIARLPVKTDFAIIEMGMNHLGEIDQLTRIAKPHIGVITAVELAHTEFFDSVEQIAVAKSEIWHGLLDDGVAILPADNTQYNYLTALAQGHKIMSFGSSNSADVSLMSSNNIDNYQEVVASYLDSRFIFNLPLLGKHQAINSMAILAVAAALDLDMFKAAKALETLKPVKGRSQLCRLQISGKSFTLIDDSYNASPASMQAAFALLADVKKSNNARAVAVLGDMLELGENEIQMHTDLAKEIELNNLDVVLTCGQRMAALANALPAQIHAGHAENIEALKLKLLQCVRANDVVLVKGSNGSKMWKLATMLQDASD